MRRAASTLVALCACALSFGQLSSVERKGISDALYVGNLKVEDLGYAKRTYAGGGFGMVRDGLSKPLDSADALMGLHAGAGAASISTLLTALIGNVYDEPLLAIQHDPPMSGLDDLPPDLRGPILGLANWINSANNEIKHATERLTPEERRELIESLPVLTVGEPAVKFGFVHGNLLTAEEAKKLLAKVDLARIRSAAARLSEAIERAIESLKAATSDFKGVIREKVGGMPIVVAGTEDDVHTDTDAMLTVDLGGNDTYRGRHGAGVGYTSVLIDMGGDDTYDVGDLNIGAGVLGIGLAYDEGGHDTFRGGSITFGAGIGGVGVLSKEGGDDTYRAETLCEGFGAFGIGLLRDASGSDDYEALLYAQGSARSEGVGWLIDGEGRDMYRCGGLADAGPKFPSAHRSCSQAYADGWAGLGGGCGLLTDLGGDDTYVCEVRGQCCALDGGLASLYDKNGNDNYNGYDEGQAYSRGSSYCTLFDLGGDDTYTMKVGSCHALGADYGVALLLDRSGDDVYMARESAPGSGAENGLGLFVDADGTDRYFGPPGKGVVARGSGSLGVFVDLNGNDVYTTGLADGESTSTQSWGVAFDQATTVPPTKAVDRPQPVPGSEKLPSDDVMSAIFIAATQPKASDAVLDALDRLVKIGAPALQWMLANRLDGADEYGVQAFVTVVSALGPEGSRQMGAKTFSATDAELAVLIKIAVGAGVKDFGAVLPGLMKKPALRSAAVAAAGDLNARAAVPDLLAACRDKDIEVVRSAVASLTKIADVQSASTAQALLLNDDFMVRKEAVSLIAKFPEQALTAGIGLAGSPDEFRARIGLDVLGALGTAESLDKIAQMLLDPRPGVRIEALMQLDGRCPEKYRLDFLSLLHDPVGSVRQVAKHVHAGAQP